MSTRCKIVMIEKGKLYRVQIYKHCDGYPSGVLPILLPFLDRFSKERGNDSEYCLAQIVREFAVKEPPKDMLGWGLDTAFHGDEEFVYVVEWKYPSYKVRVLCPRWASDAKTPLTLKGAREEFPSTGEQTVLYFHPAQSA